MRNSIGVLLIAVVAWAGGYLYALSRQSGVPIVFNTQPVWVLMKPYTVPYIQIRDDETVILRRSGDWFTASCMETSSTSVHPNYRSPECWPQVNKKLLDEEHWPSGFGELSCEWKSNHDRLGEQ